jgi:hypothetical protein
VSLRTYGFDEETEDLAAWLRDVGGPVGTGDVGLGGYDELSASAAPSWAALDPAIEAVGTSNGGPHDPGVEGNGQLETGA